MKPEDIDKISKLISEDPDIFNKPINEAWPNEDDFEDETWRGSEGSSYDDVEKRRYNYEDEQALQQIHDNAIDKLRDVMLSPEEKRQAEFEKEKRGRRDALAFQRSMEAPDPEAVTCDRVQSWIAADLEDGDVDLQNYEWDLWDHIQECPECDAFKEHYEMELIKKEPEMDYDAYSDYLDADEDEFEVDEEDLDEEDDLDDYEDDYEEDNTY